MSVSEVVVHVCLVNLTTESQIDLLVFNVLQCRQKHCLTSHQLYKLNDTDDFLVYIQSMLIKRMNVHNSRDCGNLSHRDPSHTIINYRRTDLQIGWQFDLTAHFQCQVSHCSHQSTPTVY